MLVILFLIAAKNEFLCQREREDRTFIQAQVLGDNITLRHGPRVSCAKSWRGTTWRMGRDMPQRGTMERGW